MNVAQLAELLLARPNQQETVFIEVDDEFEEVTNVEAFIAYEGDKPVETLVIVAD